jgi:hypothetical protein
VRHFSRFSRSGLSAPPATIHNKLIPISAQMWPTRTTELSFTMSLDHYEENITTFYQDYPPDREFRLAWFCNSCLMTAGKPMSRYTPGLSHIGRASIGKVGCSITVQASHSELIE